MARPPERALDRIRKSKSVFLDKLFAYRPPKYGDDFAQIGIAGLNVFLLLEDRAEALLIPYQLFLGLV